MTERKALHLTSEQITLLKTMLINFENCVVYPLKYGEELRTLILALELLETNGETND